MTGRTAETKPPKVIAGVRLPKRLRRPIASLLAFASHPLISDALAAALVAGAGAAASGKGRRSVAKAAGLGAGAAAVKSGHGANRLGIAVLVALAEIAVARLTQRSARREAR